MKHFERTIKLSPNNEMDVDLLRLMACFNDLQRATQAMLMHFEKETADELEREIFMGDRVYYFRMILGHLYEGLGAFRRFCTLPEAKETVKMLPVDCRKAFDTLVEAAEPGKKDGFYKTVFGSVRSDAVFHYPATPFSESLQAIISERADGDETFKLIIGEKMSGTRYSVADMVLAGLFGLKVGKSTEKLEQFITQIRDIQIAMNVFIDCFLSCSGHVVS